MSDSQGEPRRPRVRDEFLAEFLALGRAIDDVLVAHHGLRASLAPDHLPFDAPMAEAMARYGMGGPLFSLWNECKAVEALRLAWTGKPSPPRADAPAHVPEG